VTWVDGINREGGGWRWPDVDARVYTCVTRKGATRGSCGFHKIAGEFHFRANMIFNLS
jgi:hypothetical protein